MKPEDTSDSSPTKQKSSSVSWFQLPSPPSGQGAHVPPTHTHGPVLGLEGTGAWLPAERDSRGTGRWCSQLPSAPCLQARGEAPAALSQNTAYLQLRLGRCHPTGSLAMVPDPGKDATAGFFQAGLVVPEVPLLGLWFLDQVCKPWAEGRGDRAVWASTLLPPHFASSDR